MGLPGAPRAGGGGRILFGEGPDDGGLRGATSFPHGPTPGRATVMAAPKPVAGAPPPLWVGVWGGIPDAPGPRPNDGNSGVRPEGGKGR